MLKFKEIIETPISLLTNVIMQAAAPDSLPEVTAMTRVTPICNVATSITHLPPELQNNLMQTALGIYLSHYLQAFSLMSLDPRVNVVSILEALNNKQRGIDSHAKETVVRGSFDILQDASAPLLTPDNLFQAEAPELPTFTVGMEADLSSKELNETANLAVGRVANITVSPDGKNRVTIPVTMNIIPHVVPSQAFAQAAGVANIDTGSVSRARKLNSGEIESFFDWLTGRDLLEQDMKGRINDQGGLYRIAADKRHPNWVKNALTGSVHINRISMFSVITMAELDDINNAVRGNILKRDRDRSKYFHDSAQAMLIVVDPRTERVYLLQREVDEVATFNYEDIKRMGSRKDGVDVNALIKDLVNGTSNL